MCCEKVRAALHEKALDKSVGLADGRRMMSLAFGLLAHCPVEITGVVGRGGAHAYKLLGQIRLAEEQGSDFAARVAETAWENFSKELDEAAVWLGDGALVREVKIVAGKIRRAT